MISIEQARRFYDGADAAHDFDHVLRVLTLAEQIARAEGADVEIVRAAALLHDVARAETAGTDRCHAEVGAERARHILRHQPPERVQAVAQAIASHRFRRGSAPETLEAQVLFDADKLDAIGAVGVARAYTVGGQRNSRLWADVPPDYAEGDPVEARDHTPAHEFVFKLSKLRDRMHTAAGRAIAAERHAFMVAFFERLGQEVRGER
ncbi:MAG: HD domain-containing protein [Chloroflexota bacterium]